ncbi:MAG: DHH family phosphoesterase [Patescibacteria group bacterium]
MKDIVILYHKDLDGFSGAWVAWRKFKNKADYLPVDYNGIIPNGFKNKEIYLIDFCYPRKEMAELLKNNKKLIAIDHHISRKDDIKTSTDFLYDVNHSGATLAWKYFYPKNPVPKLLLYIEDIDLWRFKLPRSREILAYLDICDFDFKLWNKFFRDFEGGGNILNYIKEGKIILKYQGHLIKTLIKSGKEAVFEGKKAFAVNSQILESEIGEFIYKNKKVIGVIYSSRNGSIKVSLRSDKEDVSKLAKKYGGGGHKAAAGFVFYSNFKFPWKIIK